MTKKTSIFFGVVAANLFDGWDSAEVEPFDEAASAEKFAESCKKRIGELVEDAAVEYKINCTVGYGIGGCEPYEFKTRYNGETAENSTDAEWIDHICGEVYQDYDNWLVNKGE